MYMANTSAYDHTNTEEKWRKAWEKSHIDVAPVDVAAKPFYNLMMFPYPSAEGLHVGNMYAFTGSDIYGRFKKMGGYDVFEPIGLDGFGIHSENYALKAGRHPMDHAARTEKNYYAQLARIGAMFDWIRTLTTYDPDYYKWTQWLFVQMVKHDLAYRGAAQVNWCPSCKTVLADEQVIDGRCERCGNIVYKRPLEQWFFRITAYAEKLLQNSFSLDWTGKVKTAQQRWIGKKEGIDITYPVVGEDGGSFGEITCFTTRPDTNFGATFVVIAPEHELVTRMLGVLKNKKTVTAIKKYVSLTNGKSEAERKEEGRKKTGIATGLFAVNRLNSERMPIYVSDFVLTGVGSGAVVGVPAHDARDMEFAHAFNLPIKTVIDEKSGNMINSEFLNGLGTDEAIADMVGHLEKKGWGKRTTTYHLRDWIISRQRYWGPPIPMIYCEACKRSGKGAQPHMPGWWTVPEKDLPVLLPRIEDYKPGDDGVAPLAKHAEFYQVKCPDCGGNARRETDVSDTFLDSSWYFLRYPSVHTAGSGQVPFDPEMTKKWLPVAMYTGGAEHSVLHLMYSRFVTMALHDWGYVDFDEPFEHFYAHGLVIKDGAKMSKSKGNVVNPDNYIKLYGADALRLYLMFMGPYSEGGDFRDSAMEGMARWIGRVWRMAQTSIKKPADRSDELVSALNKLVKKVTEDMEKRRYNTAIASMMEFTNFVADHGGAVGESELNTFILLLAPFAPYITEELWAQIHKVSENTFSISKSVHTQPWPTYDALQVRELEITLIVQVNGKLKERLTVSSAQAANEAVVTKKAHASEKIQAVLQGKKVKKTIFVPGRLINFVV
jgi:leucyl-tRNA synthetase